MKIKELIKKLQKFNPEHYLALNYRQEGKWHHGNIDKIFKVSGDNKMVAIQPFQPDNPVLYEWDVARLDHSDKILTIYLSKIKGYKVEFSND